MITPLTASFEDDAPNFAQSIPLIAQNNLSLLPEELIAIKLEKDLHKKVVAGITEEGQLVAIGNLQQKKSATQKNLHSVLGVGQIVSVNLDEPDAQILVLGMYRSSILNFSQKLPFPVVEVARLEDVYSETEPSLIQALSSEIISSAKKLLSLQINWIQKNEALPPDFIDTLENHTLVLGELCDSVAAFFGFDSAEKQMILNELDVIKRADKLLFILRFYIQSSSQTTNHNSKLVH